MQRRVKIEAAKGQTRGLGWTLRRERLIYTGWQGRERDGKDVQQIRAIKD